jgi:2-dehydropantoate 2-reductase
MRTGAPTVASPRVAIVGAGAIGSAIAFAFARAGLAPTLVARGAALDAIRRDGLRVEMAPGLAWESGRVRLATCADTAALGPQDVVIGTMKAQDWPDALPLLRPLIGPETIVLPAINGIPWWYFDGVAGPLAGEPVRAVDPAGALLAGLPSRHVVGAVVYMGVSREAPGIVAWTSGNRLVIGEAAGANRARTQELAALLGEAGFTVAISADIRAEIWAKLLGNATCNPLSVVARARIDEIMSDAGLASLTLTAMHEVAAVAQAVGAPPEISVAARFAINRELGAFRTSMLQDYEAGRALELGALVDAVVEIGERCRIATPMVAALGALARRAVALR